MESHFTIKELIRPVISHRLVNLIAIFIFRLIQPVIPDSLLVRIPINGVVTCALAGSKKLSLFSEADDPIVSGLCFRGLDGYEPESIHLFRTFASSAEVIMDIGANTGIYALVAAAENPSSKVYAFEPVPRIYQRLEKNRSLNKASNLQLSQSVIANFNGNTTLYIPIGKMPTSSSIVKGHRRAEQKIEVRTTTLDTYVELENILKVDLMKIDTEATEQWVLEGGIKMIERDRPAIVCEVLKTDTGRAIQNILDKLGYLYFWITADGLIKRSNIQGDPEFKYLNYLFIQPDRIPVIESLIISGE